MSNQEQVQPKRRLSDRSMIIQFLALDFLYLFVVYAWTVYFYPLGRDFSYLAGARYASAITGFFWSAEVSHLGNHLPSYHLVNLALLYGCMVLLFVLTRCVTGGAWWLGSLAAVLLMANPVKSEAVLNLCGVVDLIPAVLVLAASMAYIVNARQPTRWGAALAVGIFTISVVPFSENLGLFFVLAAYEGIGLSAERRTIKRLFPYFCVFLIASVLHRDCFSWAACSPTSMFGPLYLIVYPIGLLPKTAAIFHDAPWLGWVAALLGLGVVLQIARKARNRAFTFGLIAAAALRLFRGDEIIDPVHMIGGGSLLAPGAFLAISAAALCGQIQRHPKWTKPIVVMTTILCVTLFVLQAQANLAWYRAGKAVQSFQQRAGEASNGTSLGIAPDYQYYRGAPMMLSESVRYDTPFSRAVAAASLLPIHFERAPFLEVEQTQASPSEVQFTFRGVSPEQLLGYPYSRVQEGFRRETATTVFTVELREARDFVVRLVSKSGSLPTQLITISPSDPL